MAAPFLGLNVYVKLKNPPSSLHGHVENVAGQRLFLRNVIFLSSGKQLKEYTVHGAEIQDIEVLPQEEQGIQSAAEHLEVTTPLPQQAPQDNKSQHAPNQIPAVPAQQAPSATTASPLALATNDAFADPAILGYQRPQISCKPDPAIISYSRSPHPPQSTPATDAVTAAFGKLTGPSSQAKTGVSASLIEPLNALGEDSELEQRQRGLGRAQSDKTTSFPTALLAEQKERQRGKKQTGHTAEPGLDSSPRTTKKPGRKAPAPATAFRNTPILEPSDTTTGAPRSTRGKKARALEKEAEKNGWTTDADDVKNLGDFDFEDNLSRFNKKAVWEELRAGDTTADEDRLASINRVKQAPASSQKLRPTENVLGSRKTSLDLSESDLELDGTWPTSGSSKRLQRNHSRPPVRKQSSIRIDENLPSPTSTIMPRSVSRHRLAQHSGLSPRLRGGEVASPESSSFGASAGPAKPSLRYISTNEPCRTTSPETLKAIEHLAVSGYGMNTDVLDENAAHGIAEIVISTIDPTGTRLASANHNASPVVILLVGEHRAGARALAAARHLMERNIRVIGALTGDVDLEAGVLAAQVQRLRGKILRSWEDTSTYLKSLDAPPELIIDALTGIEETFDDFLEEHFATALEMVGWANKSRAHVLAIDIPSGVNPSNGDVQMHEGEPLEIRARLVVSCGIPVHGLLEAMSKREEEQERRLFVVDVGLNPAARQFVRLRTTERGGQKSFVQFGSGWVAGLRFIGAS